MKKLYITICLFAVTVVGVWYASRFDVSNDYKNATYKIEGRYVKLVDGLSEESLVPGSASKVITRYFGNEAHYDFDGDGRKDVALLLTQETGGTGLFYYVVVALNTKDGYVGTDATIIGDRISPQTTNINEKGFIVVNFAERKPGESFSVQPSVGRSIWFKYDPTLGQLGEVVQNFEGESR